MENKTRYAEVLLSIGVAFAPLYAAISGFAHPENWIGFFPAFMQGIAPDSVLLGIFGAIEIILAIWILSGWKTYVPSVIIFIVMMSIVLFNFTLMDIVFRDITIGLSALALASLSYRK